MSDYIMLHFAGGRQIHENDDELDMLETESKEEVKVMENAIDIASPAEGKAISLSEVADATFAQEILGKGAAIVPEKGVIYAPFDGKVDVMLFEWTKTLNLNFYDSFFVFS